MRDTFLARNRNAGASPPRRIGGEGMMSKTTIPDPGLPTSVGDVLARMAADAKGPFGRTPLARLAEAYIAVFEELRLLRASWRQITFLLAAHGITGENGPTTNRCSGPACRARARHEA
jgi:hypothetical protein